MTVRDLPGFRAYDLPKGGPATDGDVRDWHAVAPRRHATAQMSRGWGWYSIEAKSDGKSATVRIYDAIGGWFGMSAADFAAEIADLDVDTIDLRLNSPGGSVFDGVAIHNALLTHRARVDVTVDGVAASIASVIAMAGDSITMGRGTRMMIHNPSGVVIGQARDMREIANLLDELGKDIAGFYAERAGKDVAHWLDLMGAETWYSAQEAVDAGLADAVLGKGKADDEKPSDELKTFDLRAYGFRYADRDQAPSPVDISRKTNSNAVKARVRDALEGVRSK